MIRFAAMAMSFGSRAMSITRLRNDRSAAQLKDYGRFFCRVMSVLEKAPSSQLKAKAEPPKNRHNCSRGDRPVSWVHFRTLLLLQVA